MQAADYYAHPVFEPTRLQLETPAIRRLEETLHRWLWTGTTGGLIVGEARVGKTTALRALTSRLKTRAGALIPTTIVSMPTRDQRTIMSVFRQLCLSAELPITTHDRADHLSDRYVHYLAERAEHAQITHVVVFVDEMQRLLPVQFNAFAELYDKLQLLGLRLSVFFIGNEQESDALIRQVGDPQYAHIHGRFFTQAASFLGLTSKDEVKFCLAQYDTLRYPVDGPTYVEYFLPEAARSGWTLASLSTDLWRVFRAHQKQYGITSWGMQYIISTTNTLLTDFLPRYGVDHVSDEILNECIDISGLVPSLVSLST